ncbi:MAG TPA: TetR/AcrR family transcriptional regulator [Pseudonocardiaceae bacterium]|nr:TetR/AcrR family transcriptional regulator [Pseudonocardiaceae bacterium]
MPVPERKRREWADRERLIVAAARELAEQQGWDAVTIRRLAERIDRSQPVLYCHFRGKREIIGAVARQGAAELAGALLAATSAADGPRARITALARAYLDFAEHNPAVYDAMFQLDLAGDVQPALCTEVFWAALHGLATLTRAGRLPPGNAERRVELLVGRLVIV